MNLLKQNQIAEVKMTYSSKIDIKLAPQIIASKSAADILRASWDDIEYIERFKVMLLNRANRVKGIVQVGVGGTSGCVADPKIILQAALLSNSTGLIIAHNHPSGNLTPSDADLTITKKIKEACKFMEIALLDHIILTDQGYLSFADEGYL